MKQIEEFQTMLRVKDRIVAQLAKENKYLLDKIKTLELQRGADKASGEAPQSASTDTEAGIVRLQRIVSGEALPSATNVVFPPFSVAHAAVDAEIKMISTTDDGKNSVVPPARENGSSDSVDAAVGDDDSVAKQSDNTACKTGVETTSGDAQSVDETAPNNDRDLSDQPDKKDEVDDGVPNPLNVASVGEKRSDGAASGVEEASRGDEAIADSGSGANASPAGDGDSVRSGSDAEDFEIVHEDEYGEDIVVDSGGLSGGAAIESSQNEPVVSGLDDEKQPDAPEGAAADGKNDK